MDNGLPPCLAAARALRLARATGAPPEELADLQAECDRMADISEQKKQNSKQFQAEKEALRWHPRPQKLF